MSAKKNVQNQDQDQGHTITLHLGAAVYRQGDYYGFEIMQNGEIITRSPPAFATKEEAQEASSKILSFAAEKVQKDLPIKRMLRVQRDMPKEL